MAKRRILKSTIPNIGCSGDTQQLVGTTALWPYGTMRHGFGDRFPVVV